MTAIVIVWQSHQTPQMGWNDRLFQLKILTDTRRGSTRVHSSGLWSFVKVNTRQDYKLRIKI